jgi:acetyl-CoA acetyltransferase
MAEWVGGKRGDGESGGALKDVSALELGAVAARGALAKSGVAAEKIDHVVMGNALQTSGDAIYGARHVALKAGVPIRVPALTVNRLCGSGIQSIINAAHIVSEGDSYVLAGGMENMSQAPHVVRGARSGFKLGTRAARRLAARGTQGFVLRIAHGSDGGETRQAHGNCARRTGRVRAAQHTPG